jgi:hypothetical protein
VKTCPHCQSEVDPRGYYQHERSCKNHPGQERLAELWDELHNMHQIGQICNETPHSTVRLWLERAGLIEPLLYQEDTYPVFPEYRTASCVGGCDKCDIITRAACEVRVRMGQMVLGEAWDEYDLALAGIER